MPTDSALAPPAHYVEEIPIELLHEVAHNRTLRDLDGLATTIREVGVLEPVLVRHTPDGNGYEIVDGARRTAASRIAGKATVPCIVDDTRDDEEAEFARIIANVQRDDPTPLEEAAAYERLITHFGKTAAEVADLVGRSESHISKRRSLLVLPTAVKAALDDDRINIQTALGITSLARDPERLDRVVDALPDVDAANEQLERERQALDRTVATQLDEQARERRRIKKLEELEDQGETIVEYPPHGQWSSTPYRRTTIGEDHEAVAVDPDGNEIKLTTQPIPERNRQVPRPPKGSDPGFVEQNRRKKEADLRRVTDHRLEYARAILSQPGRDAVLTEYVITTVWRSMLQLDAVLDYARPDIIRELLALDVNTPLAEYASRTNLTALRTAAASVMAISELELRDVGNRPKPGQWAEPADAAEFTDDHAPERAYLELLSHHGYELSDEERAAITPVEVST